MSAVKLEPGVWSLIEENRQMEARVERAGDEFVVSHRGRQLRIRIEDPREWSGSDAAKSGTGVAKLVSPMPGKIVRVLVAVGDLVSRGQGLVVVEAMKMQNELKSPIDGVVRQVQAEAGATVTANQTLVVVHADAS
ncbi:biotin/lipoyl-containing protein [Bryobacter aggregatus]|uniref:biotin/lipoyl-containing protein n=1 Tax=Bryobacter aggregatus TaxID=360054 RepID=UPI00068F5BA6|nr:biotin/lipoyl-containing protein [Bryobacter aggregatus]